MSDRFRGFLPVVVDVETGGFNCKTDALLEIAAVFLFANDKGLLTRGETIRYHVNPFEGANLEPASLAVNGIDPEHPLRLAVDEKEALQNVFGKVRRAVREAACTRAILVGHNSSFDLGFINEAATRTSIKRNPFRYRDALRCCLWPDRTGACGESRRARVGRGIGSLRGLRCRSHCRRIL